MKIKWEVSDNYIGKSRPQYLNIDEDKFEDCETFDEAMDLLFDAVKEDFFEKIDYEITNFEEVQNKIEEIIENKEH